MGWWADPEGNRGYFSDDQGIPQDWHRIADPHVPADPLDHDNDGEKGGSVKGPQATAAKGKRRKKAR